ncbi:MAG: hypothetical protein FWC68_00345, partial [Oscillospiraceae bacterium]|nr:hypothetical protein [Oscillospiraceae bacterium]
MKLVLTKEKEITLRKILVIIMITIMLLPSLGQISYAITTGEDSILEETEGTIEDMEEDIVEETEETLLIEEPYLEEDDEYYTEEEVQNEYYNILMEENENMTDISPTGGLVFSASISGEGQTVDFTNSGHAPFTGDIRRSAAISQILEINPVFSDSDTTQRIVMVELGNGLGFSGIAG